MTVFALIKDDRVVNTIVADDPDWVTQHAQDEGMDSALALDPDVAPIGVGYVRKGNKFIPPEVLELSKGTIDPDGSDAVTLTYTNNLPNPPSSIDILLNEQPTPMALSSGKGSIDVTSRSPGDVITVVAGGTTAQIGVTGG